MSQEPLAEDGGKITVSVLLKNVSRYVPIWTTPQMVTGQLADNAINQLEVNQITDWSTRGLVNSPQCLIYNLQYIIALSVISDRLHYLYAVDIQ